MDEKNLAAMLEAGLKDLAGRIEVVREGLEQQGGEIRQAHIQIEDLHGAIRQLAEGITNIDEKLGRHAIETKQEFDDVRAMMRLSYVQLEQRVVVLEHRDEEIDARLTGLETAGR